MLVQRGEEQGGKKWYILLRASMRSMGNLPPRYPIPISVFGSWRPFYSPHWETLFLPNRLNVKKKMSCGPKEVVLGPCHDAEVGTDTRVVWLVMVKGKEQKLCNFFAIVRDEPVHNIEWMDISSKLLLLTTIPNADICVLGQIDFHLWNEDFFDLWPFRFFSSCLVGICQYIYIGISMLMSRELCARSMIQVSTV
jgi:hypothetical protein